MCGPLDPEIVDEINRKKILEKKEHPCNDYYCSLGCKECES